MIASSRAKGPRARFVIQIYPGEHRPSSIKDTPGRRPRSGILQTDKVADIHTPLTRAHFLFCTCISKQELFALERRPINTGLSSFHTSFASRFLLS